MTLALLFAATYTRLTRATMLETMSEDYIRTARAKGLKERDVVAKHALRSGAHPDHHDLRPRPGRAARRRDPHRDAFSLPGTAGEHRRRGQKDLPIILGVTLFAAFFIVIANLIVDLLYAVIDPRVRLS